jgi:tRNA pseudouridine32 synthase/23S rRNA pseudouridine746 synthase
LIVFADDAFVVAAKPAGQLAVPGRGEDKQDCLWRRVQREVADALVVHRLDQATSGLMLFARGVAVQRALGRAFMQRAVDKTYVAVVAGEVAGEQGEIDLPLAVDWPNRPRQVVDPVRGKASLTRWRVLGRGDGTTCLALEPVTGRSHQLRVHLLAIGHPIVGDSLYAPPEVAAAAPRLLLHASRLAFDHPSRHERVAFESPPPF